MYKPLVHSNIVLANSFPEGFKAVFTIFSKDIWSSSMNKSYFFYVAKAGILLSVLLLIIVAGMSFLATIPLVGFVGSIMMMMGVYVFMVFMSIVSMMARRIVEE